jgi:hypothetical protein
MILNEFQHAQPSPMNQFLIEHSKNQALHVYYEYLDLQPTSLLLGLSLDLFEETFDASTKSVKNLFHKLGAMKIF